jgi:hypothetical protein
MESMTVLEVFARAFGPLPEGVEGCYVGYESEFYDYAQQLPTVLASDSIRAWFEGDWCDTSDGISFAPNIADRPAESFRGFFGDRYDAVLDEVKGPLSGFEHGPSLQVPLGQ